MRVQTNIRKIGGTLYLRIPSWFAQLRALGDGDAALWKPEDLITDDCAVRLQFVKAASEATEASE
jgi:hypothetical protein